MILLALVTFIVAFLQSVHDGDIEDTGINANSVKTVFAVDSDSMKRSPTSAREYTKGFVKNVSRRYR